MKSYLNTYLATCLLAAACCFTTTYGNCQAAAKKEKIHFSSINTIGLSTGTSGENLYLQTINGIRYKSWNLGIGTGIDWTGIKSVPLLLDVRKTFTTLKHKPFVYGNAGVNYTWGDNSDINVKQRFDNGFCGETGLGYYLQLKNQTAIVLSAGFSYKHDHFDQAYGYYLTIWPAPSENYTTYDYYYRRLVLRVGIKF